MDAILRCDRPLIRLASGEQIRCDFILGCDGFYGVSRAAATGCSCSGVNFDASWLALLAESPPSSDHTVYGLHPDGFAGHMLRSATISRFYLQIDAGSTAEEWTDQRVCDQIQQRLSADVAAPLPGPILQRSTLERHSCVTEPMQQDRLFLAGDAAHIVTPAGGKGMNPALHDVQELGSGLLDHYQRGDDARLSAYSTARLPAVWRAVEFSHWMLDLLLARPALGRFHEGLREARLARLLNGGFFTRHFAFTYVGHPESL